MSQVIITTSHRVVLLRKCIKLRPERDEVALRQVYTEGRLLGQSHRFNSHSSYQESYIGLTSRVRVSVWLGSDKFYPLPSRSIYCQWGNHTLAEVTVTKHWGINQMNPHGNHMEAWYWYLLDPWNYINIWQVPPMLNNGDTCQIFRHINVEFNRYLGIW